MLRLMIYVAVQKLVGLSHKNDFGKSCDSIFAMTWRVSLTSLAKGVGFLS